MGHLANIGGASVSVSDEGVHVLTSKTGHHDVVCIAPDQARALAALLTTAADAVERRRREMQPQSECPDCVRARHDPDRYRCASHGARDDRGNGSFGQ